MKYTVNLFTYKQTTLLLTFVEFINYQIKNKLSLLDFTIKELHGFLYLYFDTSAHL